MAAAHGRLRCLKLLIEDHKMDVNLPSRCGWRPLHLVSNEKNRKRAKECLEFLLQCGADVNAQSENKVTPLHQAAKEGLKDCLAILVENGADVHAKDMQGNQPIDLCKIWCHRDCARYLHNAMWKKDKEEQAHELKKMEKLKRNILEMDQEALLKMTKSHIIPQQTCFGEDRRTKKAPEKAEGISIRREDTLSLKQGRRSCKSLLGKGKLCESLDMEKEKKRTDAKSMSGEAKGAKKLEDVGERSGLRSECRRCQWNPSCNPTMTPVTDIYRIPTLRLGIDPEDVTTPDFSNVIALDKDERGQPQIKTIQGQIFSSQPNLPYETIERCLFPETGPKERIRMPHEFKANHVFDVPKKQQPTEGRKPGSEISLHLRQTLPSRFRTANECVYY